MNDDVTEYKGYTITITPDDMPKSPREWDNLGVMLCSHNRYTLGDTQLESSNFDSWQAVYKWLQDTMQAVVILPLYLYDHSGITMYTSDDTTYHQHEAWDSGQVGYIYATRDAVLQEYSVKRVTKDILARAEKILRNEVKTYDQYLTGDVWSISITDANGNDIEACSGFYGDDYALSEAKGIVDYNDALPPSKRDKIVAPYANALHD